MSMTDERQRAALQLAIEQERVLLREACRDVRVTMQRIASPPELQRKLRPALPYLAAGLGLLLFVRARRHGLKAALVLPAIEIWQLWQRLASPPARPMPALVSASTSKAASGGAR